MRRRTARRFSLVTNHWVESSYDGVGWTVGTVFPNRDLVVPAGATMKRFVVTNNDYQATTNGAGLAAVGNFALRQSVDIVSGAYAPRRLLLRRCPIPKQVVGLYDPVSANRIYSELLHGGDNEFEINEKTSYGLRSGPTFTVRLSTQITGGLGFTGLLSNTNATVLFRVLYETLP